ncbi:MAG: hypothetical protein JWQ71_3839 [Pedosphaera sp.]|nr:hypothetical protein [Pedosphaera sp.]
MNCPVCKTRTLATHALEHNLISWKCDDCGGQWINSFQFWKWLEEHQPNHEGVSPRTPDLTSNETKAVKTCPECNHILAKYKVGHSLPFSLDRCGHCGGIWFDKNEWEILQGLNLHEEIHHIFSAPWQHRVRNEERARHLQALFAEKIGVQDFEEIKRIKEWLNQHPHRDELHQYLNNKDF